jgi:hypothetical protein
MNPTLPKNTFLKLENEYFKILSPEHVDNISREEIEKFLAGDRKVFGGS